MEPSSLLSLLSESFSSIPQAVPPALQIWYFNELDVHNVFDSAILVFFEVLTQCPLPPLKTRRMF